VEFDESDIDQICSALEARGYFGPSEQPATADPNLVAQLESQERIAEIHADADVAIAEAHTEAETEVAEAVADVAEAQAEAAQVEAEVALVEAEAEAELVAEPPPEDDLLETLLDGDGSPTPIEDAVEDAAVSVADVVEDAAPRRTHWFHRNLTS
jgi:hypothetical protein